MTGSAAALACLVPVLPTTGRADGVPVAAVRLHGRSLYVHAARTLYDTFGAELVVAAPEGGQRSVRSALAADGLPEVPVVCLGDTLGQVLVGLLARPGAWSDPAAALLVHDPRCPLTPPAALRQAVAAGRAEPGAVVVAARPMTDTVKELVEGVVRATVPREGLRVVASPLVLPVALLGRLADAGALAGCADVDALLQAVRAAGTRLVWAAAPVAGRRVSDAAGVALLECLTEVR